MSVADPLWGKDAEQINGGYAKNQLPTKRRQDESQKMAIHFQLGNYLRSYPKNIEMMPLTLQLVKETFKTYATL